MYICTYIYIYIHTYTCTCRPITDEMPLAAGIFFPFMGMAGILLTNATTRAARMYVSFSYLLYTYIYIYRERERCIEDIHLYDMSM